MSVVAPSVVDSILKTAYDQYEAHRVRQDLAGFAAFSPHPEPERGPTPLTAAIRAAVAWVRRPVAQRRRQNAAAT